MRKNFEFKVLKKSKKSDARLGILTTPHGQVKTPAFVTVGSKGTVKSLTPEDLDRVGTQMVFVNTYHTALSPGIEIVEKAGGIHQLSGIKQVIITDSGGFQVFSLPGAKRRNDAKKKARRNDAHYNNFVPPVKVKISDDGVEFRSPIDGKSFFFTPEFSIEAQKKIGGDLMVAFDECTYYGASYKYTKKAMERTHSWAKRSLVEFDKRPVNENLLVSQLASRPELRAGAGPLARLVASNGGGSARSFAQTPPERVKFLGGFNKDQRLFGVIQGGLFKDLRQQSAKFISSLPFFGLAIGGVSVGETKKEMREQVSWVREVIKDDPRPLHLLGVGEVDDIFATVKMGVDSMDCVIPTRHARMGKLYRKVRSSRFKAQSHKEIDIFKSKYRGDLNPVDESCQCYTCRHFTRAYLHHLFKQRELLGYRLATIHNLYFFERLFKNIRRLIKEDKL